MCTDWKAQSVLCLGERQNKACGYTHKDLILIRLHGFQEVKSNLSQWQRWQRGLMIKASLSHTIVLLGIWYPNNTEILHPSGVTGSQQRQVNGRKGQEQTEWAQYVHVGFLFLLSPLMTPPHHWQSPPEGKLSDPDCALWLSGCPTQSHAACLFCCQTVEFLSRLWEFFAR